jgi:type II secretory pathway pseudopilin PulG
VGTLRTTPKTLAAVSTVVAIAVVVATAALLVPEFRRAAKGMKERAVAADLAGLDEALEHYAQEHDGRLPGATDAGVDVDAMAQELRSTTTRDGALVPDGPCRAQLPAGVPPNPWNGSSSIKVATSAELPPPDGRSGWLFHLPTRTFHSNAIVAK